MNYPLSCPACNITRNYVSEHFVHYPCGACYSIEYEKFVAACFTAFETTIPHPSDIGFDRPLLVDWISE